MRSSRELFVLHVWMFYLLKIRTVVDYSNVLASAADVVGSCVGNNDDGKSVNQIGNDNYVSPSIASWNGKPGYYRITLVII